MFSTKPVLAGVVVCAFLAGCSGFSQPSAPLSQTGTQARMRVFTGSVPPAGTPVVYVSEFFNSEAVNIYLQSGKGQKPIGSITGFVEPSGLAVDANGDLYVGDIQANTISVFHQGQTTPYRTLTGATGVLGVAVDSQENVYAASTASPTVYVWAPGSTSPTSTLTASFEGGAGYVAVDAAGDVFVDSGTIIDEFPAGSTTPVVLRNDQGGGNGAQGLALDSSQNLVAVSGSGIDVYAPPYTGKATEKLKSKDGIGPIALNGDDSDLWYTDPTKLFAVQLTYPTLKKVESTKKLGRGTSLEGIALYPAAPL